jgi:hypothetical protein
MKYVTLCVLAAEWTKWSLCCNTGKLLSGDWQLDTHGYVLPPRSMSEKAAFLHPDMLFCVLSSDRSLVEADEEREKSMSEQSASAVSLFHTELEVPLKASPERIYQALTRDLADWWDPEASWGRGK